MASLRSVQWLVVCLAVCACMAHSDSLLNNPRVVSDVRCDDQSACPDGSTCCIQDDGHYGCCLGPNAVCCSDKNHCCPESTTCNLAMSRCDPVSSQLQWMNKLQVLQKVPKSQIQADIKLPTTPIESVLSTESLGATGNIVICPDPTRACPDGNTCCLMPNHQWVCCGLPHAACCADGFHCCPYGTRCDPTSTHCYRQDGVTRLLAYLATKNGSLKK